MMSGTIVIITPCNNLRKLPIVIFEITQKPL